jgi:hypothetical protein
MATDTTTTNWHVSWRTFIHWIWLRQTGVVLALFGLRLKYDKAGTTPFSRFFGSYRHQKLLRCSSHPHVTHPNTIRVFG